MLVHQIITIQWIAWFVLSTLIHWVQIYLVDSVIHLLNDWGLVISGLVPDLYTIFLATKLVDKEFIWFGS